MLPTALSEVPELPVPPELPTLPVPGPGTGGDGDGVHVYASVTVFGKHHAVELYFPELPPDHELAGELWGAVSAVAAMQGGGVWMELQRRCAAQNL